ncbi:MAG: membrane protein insertase YidC [Kofleriaceae bacterium]
MQDQGKRLLLAVGLALGLMLLWQVIFPPAKPAPKPPVADGSGSSAEVAGPVSSVGRPAGATTPVTQPTPSSGVGVAAGSGSAAGSAAEADGGSAAGSAAAAGSADGSAAAGSAADPGSDAARLELPPTAVEAPPALVLPTEQPIELAFPGVVVTFTNHGAALKSWKLTDPKYARDHTHGEFVPAQPGRGALQVNFANSSLVIPANATWVGEKLGDTSVRYTYAGADLKVVKTFTVHPAEYLVQLVVDVTVTGGASPAMQTLAVTSFAYEDPAEKPTSRRGQGALEWRASCMRGESVRTANVKKVHAARTAAEIGTSDVTWGGFTHGYLLLATAPRRAPGEVVACNAYPGVDDAGLKVPGMLQLDLLVPPVAQPVGAPPQSRELWTYIGPTHYRQLKGAAEVAGYHTGFEVLTDFGWFGFIGKPLLWLLHTFHGWVGNWGIAIIMLTILVKLATLYWTTKSMRSMKAMAALAPKMKELQAKYGSDRARIQVETMALYKEHGVNPLAGCLPILLQMPIWIALYRMLSSAGELYLEPFIPGWIGDLTQPDPFHVLPILLIVTMFAQAKLQPQTQTGLQQKLLMYGLPLGFGIAAFFFPSGLSLYIFTNTLLSAAHSIYMNKFDKKSLELAAMAAEAAKPAIKVSVPAPASDATDDDADDDEGDDASPARPKAGGSRPGKPSRKRKPRRN